MTVHSSPSKKRHSSLSAFVGMVMKTAGVKQKGAVQEPVGELLETSKTTRPSAGSIPHESLEAPLAFKRELSPTSLPSAKKTKSSFEVKPAAATQSGSSPPFFASKPTTRGLPGSGKIPPRATPDLVKTSDPTKDKKTNRNRKRKNDQKPTAQQDGPGTQSLRKGKHRRRSSVWRETQKAAVVSKKTSHLSKKSTAMQTDELPDAAIPETPPLAMAQEVTASNEPSLPQMHKIHSVTLFCTSAAATRHTFDIPNLTKNNYGKWKAAVVHACQELGTAHILDMADFNECQIATQTCDCHARVAADYEHYQLLHLLMITTWSLRKTITKAGYCMSMNCAAHLFRATRAVFGDIDASVCNDSQPENDSSQGVDERWSKLAYYSSE